ncbi:hypothetical protein EMIHUDRAFT_232668 [Emiliania huxleyi CCMP1516]|uniref:Aminoglycoside phosphotransferase domain-containing protein n=2 Tax=Emiliania huxleyi TaxID=2903 RepID=A0A0D3JBP7_EMIH1|nr:hypothetical protein EMIHUDRAFT_101649 [Emiliania huxleyi CCMP1516]XP_005783085.1 hypothetical protein EMIHUDRAFT_232668 [Emiliania huxleyi CCMP1516]EOD20932.1 hypothetical protein EMIHUDRAFT_101649 [Emiliania huxleyi CCMP1516]EOD30656.1 hypothetical protein EMIHUDRAFT_232668 [Emiliania huxleyi CCMP1516]|eukprot:XP_005773361.1 hypothetical protein EMIHUDRAFT_101649 [Emiliania huxleyi CCMP1516]
MHASAAALYVARCACDGEAWADGFAPEGASRLLLRALSPDHLLALPRCVASCLLTALVPSVAAVEIADGNVNYSFRVYRRGCRSLFLKRATGYLKWQPSMALEAERMRREVQYYRDVAQLLGEADADALLPRLLHFDERRMVVVIAFLEDHSLLIERCFASEDGVPGDAAAALGRYLGTVHGRTLERPGREAQTAERAVAYWNHALRAVQLEHVFTVCFEASERGRVLAKDAAFMSEVSELKALYLGYSLRPGDVRALCHGDLHAGSVMVSKDGGSVKVIDPEFAVWCAPGLDVGSLLFALVCGFIFRLETCRATGSRAVGTATYPLTSLREAIARVWEAYSAALTAEGVDENAVERIGEDAVGFAMLEAIRTSLGFAGARDPGRRLTDPKALERYQESVVRLARRCMLGRRADRAFSANVQDGGSVFGIDLLLAELDRAQRGIFSNTKQTP